MTSEPRMLNSQELLGAPPHRLSGHTHRHIVRAWLMAASVIGLIGIVLYGRAALWVLLTCVAAAVGVDTICSLLSRNRTPGRTERAALTGLLLGLTFPATIPWAVATFGAVVSILIGQVVFQGTLQPALVGRVVAQFVFSGYLSLGGALAYSPVLTPGHVLMGDIRNAERVADYRGWLESQESTTFEAYELERPVQILRRFAVSQVEPDGDLRYTPLIRDLLPPWEDTIFGVVPGGIGETCTVGLIIVGLYLIHRGFLRWQLPLTVLASAAFALSILPVEIARDYRWFPALEIEQGRAGGMAYILYHLTSGQLMLTAFLLAGDVTASPMRVHGQILYAAGIGVIAVFMRLYGVLDGECYWAVLIMNAFVTTIDRQIRRPVLGV